MRLKLIRIPLVLIFHTITVYSVKVLLMLVYVPFILLFIVVLIAIGVFGRKLLAKHSNKGQLKVATTIGTLAEILLFVFGVMGADYIHQSQNVGAGCPSHYPYITAVVITGIIGFFSFLFATYQSFAWNKKNSFVFLIATITLLVTTIITLFYASFCLTW